MKIRWIPLFATTSAMALAVVASAQDRGQGGDRGSRSSTSHSDRPSKSRADHTDDRSHDDRTDRHDTSRDARRTDSSAGRSDNHTDARSDTHADTRPDRAGGTDTGRRNPFDYGTRGSTDRPGDRGGSNERPAGHATIGEPARAYQNTPSHYDGRGVVQETRFSAPPSRSVLGVDIHRGAPRTAVSVSVGGVYGGLRVGYVSYSGGYGRGGGYGPRNSFSVGVGFGYPFYAYDPYAPDVTVVASPWYRYSYLPPYLDRTHVIVVNDYPRTWVGNDWPIYDYDRDRNDVAARNSVDDLQDAFERRSDRIADRLIPLEGDIAIYNNGKYDYSLNPDDFQKMLLDGVDQSKTVRYEILEVRRRGDEIRVRARHTYEDSWGQEQSVVHEITMRRENGGDYVIREFGSE